MAAWASKGSPGKSSGAAPKGGAAVLLLGSGPGGDYPRPTADRKPSEKVAPVVQLAGRLVRFACALVSEFPAPTAPRSRNLRVPVGPSTAIQYVWPAVTLVAGTATSLFCPATGAVIVPLASSVPGWLPAT